MNKPKMLYASPFWPMKSGISEYSEVLVYGLADYFDLTLLTDSYKLDSKKLSRDFPVVVHQSGAAYHKYDAILYNIGNNPEYHSYMYDAIQQNPGYLILHDFVLYYLSVGYYRNRGCLFQKLYEMEGVRGIQTVKQSLRGKTDTDLLQHKDIAPLLPLSKEIVRMAKGIFVHSNCAKEMVEADCDYHHIQKINHIKLSFTPVSQDPYAFAYKEYRIPKDATVIGSIGFIAPTKQNDVVCRAVKAYNQTHDPKIYYLMIGEGSYVDEYLDEYIIKTGFLPEETYLPSIERCDLIFNLRYPSNGETSGTLIQCMGRGKPCVISEIGWFGELPDDTVIKVPAGEELDPSLLPQLLQSDHSAIAKKAMAYVNTECLPKNVAKEIYTFILHKQ